MQTSTRIFLSVIAILIVFESCTLSAQGIPKNKEIYYLFEDGELKPKELKTFEYVNDSTFRKRSQFKNITNTIEPSWGLVLETTNFFDGRGRLYNTNWTDYNLDGMGEKITRITEQKKSYSQNDLLTRELLTYTDFNNTDDVSRFSAQYTEYKYDLNDCLIEEILQFSEDINLNEENWKVLEESYFEKDEKCNLISKEEYSYGKLECTYYAERNAQGLITYEETVEDITSPFYHRSKINKHEYDEEGRLIFTETVNRVRENLQRLEIFYSYNPLDLNDTILTIVYREEEIGRQLEVFKYDRFENIIFLETINFDDKGNRTYTSIKELTYNDNNLLTNDNVTICSLNQPCYSETIEIIYQDDGLIEKILTHYFRTIDGDIVTEEKYIDEFIYNCAGQVIEKIYSDENKIGAKFEIYYPLLPDCENQPLVNQINIFPNPTADAITIVSEFLNGEETRLGIYTPTGDKIYSAATSSESFFRIANLGISTGHYIVNLTRDGVAISERLLIINE